jgi:integrase
LEYDCGPRTPAHEAGGFFRKERSSAWQPGALALFCVATSDADALPIPLAIHVGHDYFKELRSLFSTRKVNIVRIITETGLRIYKELTPMRKDQVDLHNAVVWIPDSKTPNGIAEVPLTPLAIEAFKSQMAISGEGPFLFPSNRNPSGHQTALKTVRRKTLRRANYFRIYDLRSTYATRLSAGGVADEWVTQMRRQSDAQVFKKYSQMKLQMKREALVKLNRRANEMAQVAADTLMAGPMCIVTVQ